MRHTTLRFWRRPRFWITLIVVWVAIAVALRLIEHAVDSNTVWYSDQWIVHLAMYLLAFAGAWLAARAVASTRRTAARGFEVVSEDRGGPGAA